MAKNIAVPSNARYAVAPPAVITAAPVKALRIAPRRPNASADAVPVALTLVGYMNAHRAYMVDCTAFTNMPCTPNPKMSRLVAVESIHHDREGGQEDHELLHGRVGTVVQQPADVGIALEGRSSGVQGRPREPAAFAEGK